MKGQNVSSQFRAATGRWMTGLGLAFAVSGGAYAWTNADQTLELNGFLDSSTHQRADYGLSKQRFRGQLEYSKSLKNFGRFTEISLNGVIRATFDGVYDFNADDFGDTAGSPQLDIRSSALEGIIPGTAWGASPVTAGNPTLPGGGAFGFNLAANPNVGLKRVGGELGNTNNSNRFGGGLEFFTPVRPCNVDSRGCIDGYMDAGEDGLRMPDFRDDHRWLREIYIDATLPLNNGDEINFRIGRQQVVWGRTDLFRVLDLINPIDFSVQNIYEEFEDSRIPLAIFSAEWRLGATEIFDDLNFQFIWNFEKHTPHNLGQGGQPYNILLAGDLFRALKTCWDVGCTVNNFASDIPAPDPLGRGGVIGDFGNLATDFPTNTLGIRAIHDRSGRDQFGMRVEGVFKSVGFSLNALTFYSQLPSLRAGIPSQNPFVGNTIAAGACPAGAAFAACPLGFSPFDPTDVPGTLRPRPFVPAFDIHFPRIWLIGTSADFYIDPIKSAIRVELAFTNGEEFADTSKPRLFSQSNVIRWVVGWDRPTYIRFLNPNRTFLLSAQVFGQHILNHEYFASPISGAKIGFMDWEYNFIGTFLFQGFYMNDRLQPRLIQAYDIRAQAYVVSPGIDWLINNNWRLTVAANLKFGRGRNVVDDGRTANGFAPFTCTVQNAAGAAAAGAPCAPGVGANSSIGSRTGFEPLGRFRSGPIGMAQHEDELQLLLRYRF